jgi:ATP-dependent 26S proteasome regulatory subunit
VAVPSGVPFCSAAEHLFAELEYLKLLLHRQVLRLRAASLLREDPFRGLYISDEEVDAILLDRACGTKTTESNSVETVSSLGRSIEACSTHISSRSRASEVAGLSVPLFRLARRFDLSPFEQFTLVTCVAPEVDSRFETLYAYVQNDVTKKRPTPDLILKLFCSSLPESLLMRGMLCPDGTLLRVPLIHFGKEPPDRDSSFLSKALRAEEGIVDYLLGQSRMDDRLRAFTTIVRPTRCFKDLYLPDVLVNELQNAGRSLSRHGGAIFVHGAKGSGKRAIAEAISAQQQRPIVLARLDRQSTDQLSLTTALQLLQREAVLQGANLFLGGVDSLFGADTAAQQKKVAFLEALDPRGFLIFVGSNAEIPMTDSTVKYGTLSFAVPSPAFADRVLLWNEAIKSMGKGTSSDVDSAILANKFTLTGGEINSVCREAAARAALRGADGTFSLADIEAAARSQSNQGLQRLARKVSCIHDWSDLILPARSARQLREVCASEKYRHIVYSRWGYDRRLAQGKGLNALFCGASGTGKTMAAGIIARELSLDLYKIDLSSVVSKYIGETEKQLNQIFHEAGSSNAILFFDEADALFGKRSEVKDAHDRYANVEVAYLLQKMEEYEGIVILATNFRRNLDDAFTRRMHHIVEFPFPDAGLREQIWKGLVPPDAPLASDVNFSFLARQFELSGGNIRNVALAAAFLAAESGGDISMEHFILGTARELQKLGRLPSRSEFREYYDLLRTTV